MGETKKTQGTPRRPENSPDNSTKESNRQQSGLEDKSAVELLHEFTEMDEQAEQEELNEEDYDDTSSDSEEVDSEDEVESEGAEAPPESEEELIRRTVDAVNVCQKRTDEDRFTVATGIVNDFHGGDFTAASDKNPWKTNSLKKLRDSKQLQVKSRRLGDWIRAAGCRAGIVEKNPQIQLSFSIWLKLIAVDDEAKRYDLAVEVHEKQLSVRQTEERVSELTRKPQPKIVTKLFSDLKNPGSLPVTKNYEKIDQKFLETEVSQKERHLLRAAIVGKREHIGPCGQFLDQLETWLAEIDL